MASTLAKIALTAFILAQYHPAFVVGQTYTTCNPLTSGGCPADPALGKTVNIDFTSGASDSFNSVGNPTYDSNGAGFTVAKSGDSPQIVSKWYIMFGHVEFVIKAAPGTGIVSSAVLQSDCLDEIDLEWIGGDDNQVQSNYFGKGQTTTYNRGAFHSAPGNHDGFNTYTIDWTAEQIVWQVNGKTVRALTQENAAAGQYPQTPMQLKIGSWAGGDPTNPPGTVQWAGGAVDYSAGPFTMYLKSLKVQDYSTGSQYTYSGSAGTWQNIQSNGGKINSGGSASDSSGASSPAVTDSSNPPSGFGGNIAGSSASGQQSNSNVYPWVPSATATLVTTTSAPTSYSGLPSGWSVSDTGKVIPPSAASTPPPSTPLFAPSSPGSPCPGVEVTTAYDDRGFLTTATIAAGPKSYDDRGSLITALPSDCQPGSGSGGDAAQADGGTTSTPLVFVHTFSSNFAQPTTVAKALGAAAAIGLLGGAFII